MRRSVSDTCFLLYRYGFATLIVGYMATLIALHAAGLFPRAGAMDLSKLIGGALMTMEGRVMTGPTMRWHQTRFVVQGFAVPLNAFHGRAVVTVPGDWDSLTPGDVVRVRGYASAPRPPTSKRTFDEEGYWGGQGVYTMLRAWSPAALSVLHPAGPRSLSRLAWRFHQRFRDFWERTLNEDESSLLLGMTLGARGVLGAELKNECIRAGVYHIVVVSGQNMGLIIGLGIALLGLARVPRRWNLAFCFLPIVFYTTAVGADPPVVRASVMAIVGLSMVAFRRDIPRIYPLAWAAAWILIREPEALFGASFQLSFGATASLLWFWPERAQRGKRIHRWIFEASAVGLIVHLGIWPLLVWYFHRISLVGFIANWTVFPLSGIVMASGLLVGTWGALSANAVPAFAIFPVHTLLTLTLWLIRKMAGCSWAVIAIPGIPLWIAVLYESCLFGILFLIHRRKKHAEITHPLPAHWHRLQR